MDPARVCIRPYAPSDRAALERALAPRLRGLYPRGDRWLDRRLDDVACGRAWARLVGAGGRLLGVALETDKGEASRKLSTLWVSPGWRDRGVGHALAAATVAGWLRAGIERGHVTVAAQGHGALSRVLVPVGFRDLALLPDRYGPGRDEAVLDWRPERPGMRLDSNIRSREHGTWGSSRSCGTATHGPSPSPICISTSGRCPGCSAAPSSSATSGCACDRADP